ncbi:hypothetical protein fh0823_09940 [Francisella halioticida]|uniref:Uncharacterized protein n=1 Tax=Francisella halioticida TaxID=549298 RepID=A0ABN5B326_9GAMM|nr:hypothetical protein CDV26_06565 [Francisella halioticida]BCD90855.1 hypothetical protein fh0823_09940 [Francisella halioticida]
MNSIFNNLILNKINFVVYKFINNNNKNLYTDSILCQVLKNIYTNAFAKIQELIFIQISIFPILNRPVQKVS